MLITLGDIQMFGIIVLLRFSGRGGVVGAIMG
jgi:hypothetical protein